MTSEFDILTGLSWQALHKCDKCRKQWNAQYSNCIMKKCEIGNRTIKDIAKEAINPYLEESK